MDSGSCHFVRRLVVVLGIVAMLGASARADTVRLKNGNVVEGEVIGESAHKFFLRLPSGTVSFFKSHIQSIERDTPLEPEKDNAAGELLGDSRLTGEAQSQVLYLRDGRRVDGTRLEESKESVLVESMYGLLQFPPWLFDQSGLFEKQWRFVKKLENPTAFDLFDELKERRQYDEAQRRERRRRSQVDFQLIEKKHAELEQLLGAKETAPLAKLARELVELSAVLESAQRSRATDLAVNAYRAAGDVEQERGRVGAALATKYYAELVKLLYTGHARRGSKKLKAVQQGFFESDPAFWEPGLRVLQSLETYDWIAEVPDLDTAPWRRRSLAVTLPETGATQLFFVKPEHRVGVVQSAPPNVVVGFEGVWALDREAAQPGEAWRQVFWCPVQQAWKADTVPEILVRHLRGVYEFLARHGVQERRETEQVFTNLTAYNQALDHLASVHYQPTDERLKDGWQEQFRIANQAFARLQGVNERVLRRRVYMQPALVHVARVHRLLLDASAGIHVDLAVAAPPRVATEYTGGSAELSVIVTALESYDLRARLQTLRGQAILRHGRSGQVREAVNAVATHPFSLKEEKKAADHVLKEWKAFR